MTPARWRFLSRRSSRASIPTCRSPTSSPWTSASASRRSTQSFDATLLLAFAGLSLLLAGVGLFGVLSYIVAQRTT
jgi:hypothetical protein